MPKRTDIKKILILGSGPIIISQACEFDYSGTQACKALREDGYEIILLNSNPATIMTDPEMAHRTYVEPITPETVAKIIRRERPDALLPTLGGQTALNVAVRVAETGILEEFGVEMIGANSSVIKKAEDRRLFRDAMANINLRVPESLIVDNLADAEAFAQKIGLSGDRAAFFHPGRYWRRGCLQQGGASRSDADGSGCEHDPFGNARTVGSRVERIRTRGDARLHGQCGHHLLDRKHGRDGRSYGRFHHGGSCPDPHRSRISE